MDSISNPTLDGGSQRLRLAFDASCSATLRTILTRSEQLVDCNDPADADLIVFGTDKIRDVRANPTYRRYRGKCIAVTESDIPTFFLPGLYAANRTSPLTKKRTRTINYFLSNADSANTEVAALIGKPVPKTYLYSFMGGVNSWARRRVFRHLKSGSDTLIEATSHYNHWTVGLDNEAVRQDQRRRYASVMAASRFSLCPRGCGLSSYRLFESMSLGVVPVIIADGWEPPVGIDWSFALFVRESQVRQLDAIVRSHESEWQARGQRAQQIYQQEFVQPALSERLHKDLVAVAANLDRGRETVAAPAAQAREIGYRVYWQGYRVIKYSALLMLHLTKLPMPVKLNQDPAEQLSRLNLKTSSRERA